MESTSLYLAQLLGLYLVMAGLIIMMRRRFFMIAVRDYVKNRALLLIYPMIQLIAGIALVLSHNIWTWGYEVIITLTGWLLLIEAIVYLLAPEKVLNKWISMMDKEWVFKAGGIFSIIFGLFLVIIGFQIQF